MRRQFLPAALLATVLPLPGSAHDYRSGDIVINHPFTRAVRSGAPTAAAYMTLRNTGAAAERLVSAHSPLARAVEFHQTSTQGGVSRMRPLEGGLVLAPGDIVRLEPGGIHAMLVGPSEVFSRGGTVPMTLRFERAGEVTVELAVEAPGARATSHEGH
ncbi:copper chaperone PCu(A)C [Roseomonas chloroacetimidivorans]|jgi:copper(I)-binding protein|uniref:copper chaperone PCu(A)C n=1 Tax=Roseomonas chloroacetimidivorans TaxID=1766656 RepID=UPI003C772BC9